MFNIERWRPFALKTIITVGFYVQEHISKQSATVVCPHVPYNCMWKKLRFMWNLSRMSFLSTLTKLIDEQEQKYVLTNILINNRGANGFSIKSQKLLKCYSDWKSFSHWIGVDFQASNRKTSATLTWSSWLSRTVLWALSNNWGGRIFTAEKKSSTLFTASCNFCNQILSL